MPQRRSQIHSKIRRLSTTRCVANGRVRAQLDRARQLLAISTLLFVIVALAGCGSAGGGSGGSGSGSGPGPEAAVDTAPVYLTPGATTANVAWPPSEGAVESYIVFESRNGSLYSYSQSSPVPSVEISGTPGESVQVTVVAVSPTGQMSPSSPPSPPMIFQEAPAAAAMAQLPAAPATPIALPSDAASDVNEASSDLASADTQEGADSDDTNADADADDALTLERLASDVREMLLRADARLPETELSNEAHGWLQARVDAEMSAGVRLAGTGLANEDALRELVWQDHAGQLFLSDGAAVLETTDLPATFEEALRLGATERFVGLADLDGDGLGDWIVEDTATADVFVIDGATHAVLDAVLDAMGDDPGMSLAGLGDFDGDGRGELLWRDQEGALALSRPTADAPALEAATATPAHFELLAIADFDGDGRDDLLGRDDAGALLLGTTRAAQDETAPLGLTWSDAGAAPTEARELVATLDVDGDGRAELAWFDAESNGIDLQDVTP